MATPSRGSAKVLEKLFGKADLSREELIAAVKQASTSELKFVRLWWKGTPHPDLIRAVADVGIDNAGGAMDQLVRLQSPTNQVAFKVFPKGTPVLDSVQLDITINRNVN
jgi:hypothetical protein